MIMAKLIMYFEGKSHFVDQAPLDWDPPPLTFPVLTHSSRGCDPKVGIDY